MDTYIPRVIDSEVERGLRSAGALVIKGPRACGKTRTALQHALSAIQLDRDTPEAAVARMQPAEAVRGGKATAH